MKKLRKIAFVIMTALLINFCGNATIMASPMNVSEQGTELKVTSKTGEELLFYKDGNEYKVLHEDGQVEVWAIDVLISSEKENGISSRVGSDWRYYRTDKYATNINWELLDTLLTVADALAVLSVTYGIIVTAASALFVIKPNTVYRVDDTYISIYDSLYWMVDCKIYRYSNYTGLIDSFVRYINW